MLADWDILSDNLQLLLARQALGRAADIIAGQAELLAEEIDGGFMQDRGGPDALRLLAGIVRASGGLTEGPFGTA